jgi:hypothetical protein
VLVANPLEDIHNTRELEMVVLNGRIYDIPSLGEEYTGTRRLRPFYWQK